MTADGARWAEALYPQHTKSSGAAAVLKAADTIAARFADRDEAIHQELDAIDLADEQDDNR